MPGSVELIRKLKADRIPMALASSSNVTDIEGDLEAIGITGVFDAVISGEHCEKGKPDPEIFLKAAAALEIAPEKCVVIEDSESGVQAAKAAGMGCIGYANPDAIKQDLHMADEVITDFAQLSVQDILCGRTTE